MKTIYFLLTALICTSSFNSCKNDLAIESVQEEVTKFTIKGKFFRVADNDRVGIEGLLKFIREIEFKGNYCHFTYVTTKMSGKYEIDEEFIYIDTGGELGILALEIMNNDELEGEGYIHGTFKREGTFDTSLLESKTKNHESEIINPKSSNPDTKVNTDKGSTTTAEKPRETSTTKEQSNDPFSPGSYGGWDGGGTGDIFGKYGKGETYGESGSGSGASRVRLNDPSIPDLTSHEDAIIHLKLTIDGQGNVVKAENVSAKTTTRDQILINKVISEVIKQVKYNKDPDSPLANVYMPVNIKAQ